MPRSDPRRSLWVTALLFAAPLACTEATVLPPLSVQIGTNKPGSVNLSGYQPLAHGDTAPVAFGTQFRWMIVLAADLHGLPANATRAAIRVDVWSDGRSLSQFRSKLTPLNRTERGGHLALNLFVVLGSKEEWAGRAAEVSLGVEAENGQSGEASVQLRFPADPVR